MAKVLAESPSVKMSVHLSLLPAKLAYYNFGMIILLFFIFFKCLSIFEFSFALTVFKIISQIPDFSIYLIILSVISNVEPKLLTVVVNVYFVCESKLGFYIKQFIKTLIWFFIIKGFIVISLAFFFKFGIKKSTI